MDLYTIQLAQWRKAKELGIPILDTTVKSGEATFAPSWEIVQGVKSGGITEEEYTRRYTELMVVSYHNNPSRWLEIIRMDSVALGCYCSSGLFCHRHILANLLIGLAKKNNINSALINEIK